MKLNTIHFLFPLFFCMYVSLQAQDWVWTHQLPSGQVPDGAEGNKNIVDDQGNIYIIGEARANTDFGQGFVTPFTVGRKHFILKYNPFGDIEWIRYFGQNTVIDLIDLSVNHQGEVTVALQLYYSSIELPDTTLTFPNIFYGTIIWRGDHMGNLIEAISVEGLYPYIFETGPGGEMFLAGTFEDTISAGGITLVSPGSTGIFFAQLAPDGQILQLRDVDKAGPIQLGTMGLSPDDALYISVIFEDTVFWGGDTIIKHSPDTLATEGLILKYDLDNGEDWSLHFQNKTATLSTYNTFGYVTSSTFTFDGEGNLYTSTRMKGVIELENTSFLFDEPREWTIIFKFSSSGQLLWDKGLEPATAAININETYVRPLESQYVQGGLILGGFLNVGVKIGTDTTLFTSLVAPFATGQHYMLLKLNADNGDFVWINSVSGPSVPNVLWDFYASTTGNIYTIGETRAGVAPLSPSLSLVHQPASFSSAPGLFSGFMVDTSFQDFQQQISGKSYADDDLDCLLDSTESGLVQIPIVALPGPYFGVTDQAGNYQLTTDTGSYQVRQMNLNILGIQGQAYCPSDSAGHMISLSTGQDTLNVNFSNDVDICPHLIVLATTSFHRRCFPGELRLQVLNQGVLDADSVILHVKFPSYITLTEADYPYTFNSLTGEYEFDLAVLPSFGSQSIYIKDSVLCDTIDLLGLTQCIEAYATPSNLSFGCVGTDPNWSGASLTTSATCLGNDTVRLTINNDAAFDMQMARSFRIFRADTLIFIDSVDLQANDSLSFELFAGGKTVRLEVEQVPYHPNVLRSISVVEGCNSGLVNTFQDDLPTNPVSERISLCNEVIGSFDPNEKYASPVGFGDTHILEPGLPIRYAIHFQNTGTDTAFRVVIRDTIAAELDLASLVVHGASHPYTLDISGKGKPVLSFIFDPIQLPDSNVNLTGSMGHVEFSLTPLSDLPLGTLVDNQAEIYFDYNPPIETGVVFHTIDTIPWFVPQDTTTHLFDQASAFGSFQLFPNPSTGKLLIQFEDSYPAFPVGIEVINLHGVIVKKFHTGRVPASGKKELIISDLSPGIYFIKIGNLGTQKVILLNK